MDLLINIDLPDIARGIAFYTQGFGLKVTRRGGRGPAPTRFAPSILARNRAQQPAPLAETAPDPIV